MQLQEIADGEKEENTPLAHRLSQIDSDLLG